MKKLLKKAVPNFYDGGELDKKNSKPGIFFINFSADRSDHAFATASEALPSACEPSLESKDRQVVNPRGGAKPSRSLYGSTPPKAGTKLKLK